MSVNGQSLGNHGPRHKLELDGKVYEVRFLDRKLKTEFENHLFRKAREMVKAVRDDMTEAEYEHKLDEMSDKYMAGGFALESETGTAYFNSASGAVYLAGLMMGIDEVEMMRLGAKHGPEITSIIKLVVAESLPQPEKKEVGDVNKGEPVPN